MKLLTEFISTLQVIGDFSCLIIAMKKAQKKFHEKNFCMLNVIAFSMAIFGDIYYNYNFRLTHSKIVNSVNIAVTLPVLIFQICQAINWYQIARKNFKFLYAYNISYYIFSAIICLILIYYFSTTHKISNQVIFYQSVSVAFDMIIWILCIICLSSAQSHSIIFLSLGCLMIVSADLEARSLYMFDMNALPSAFWIHIVWTTGVLLMLIGLLKIQKKEFFKFTHQTSIQVIFNAWISFISLVVFFFGFCFLNFFSLKSSKNNLHLMLWNFPIILMFIVSFSVFSGNRLSQIMTRPITDILESIIYFNSFNQKRNQYKDIYEFSMLNNFVYECFSKISNQLMWKTKISHQVAHDIRSPLASLQLLLSKINSDDEKLNLLLKESMNQMYGIISDLENESRSNEKNRKTSLHQVATLLQYSISACITTYPSEKIKINLHESDDFYLYFINTSSIEMKRVLTNVLNNACDSIIEKGNGIIDIFVCQKENSLQIKISDDGIGLSKDTKKFFFKRGFTTKSNGSGLGLSHAKEYLASCGGSITLKENIGPGVSVYINFPSSPIPKWFASSLIIKENALIYCFDDNISIFHIWKEKFSDLLLKNQLHFVYKLEKIISILKRKTIQPKIFFIDYDFPNHEYNGIDVIKMIVNIKSEHDEAYLVTNRSDENEIQSTCEKLNIKIIPKLFVSKIRIKLL